MSGEVLVVVATEAEAARLPRLEGSRLVVCGVGAVNAALATQAALLERRPCFVLNAGIGGAYPLGRLPLGGVAVASASVFAGLGAEDGPRFLGFEELGFPLMEHGGRALYNVLLAADESGAFARAAGAAFGPILTLETVTGSSETAARLEARYPGALVEAMEGAGVARAALGLGVPFLEVRAVSNPVGPRDRANWDIPAALTALGRALVSGWPVLAQGQPGNGASTSGD